MPCTMPEQPFQQGSLTKGTCRYMVHQGLKQQKHAGQGACPPIPGPACLPASPNTEKQRPTGRQAWLEQA
jgi:hypothetical protein